MLAIATVLALGGVAGAHQDPPGCLGIDVSQSLTTTRFDGVTGTAGGVTECETIKVRTRLSWVSECLVAGGTYTLLAADPTDPNNAAKEVVLGTIATVPCLGDATTDADGCMVGQSTSVTIGPVDFQVRPVDVSAGHLLLRARWENGVLHSQPGNVGNQSNTREVEVPIVLCGDDAFCTGEETCDPNLEGGGRKGLCVPGTPPCTDNLFCSDVTCDEETDSCQTTDHGSVTCADNLFCQNVTCNETTDTCDSTDDSAKCGSSDGCVARSCNETTDMCDTTDLSGNCGSSDECTIRGCDPAQGTDPGVSGCTTEDTSSRCDDGDPCTDDICDPIAGCQSTPKDPLPPECQQPTGCRITGGGLTPLGTTDPDIMGEITRASFGGQVGAPCGCIGCFDELEHIQGEWNHVRHRRRGHFKATAFDSLVCGCDGVFDGKLCNPDDRVPGPEPRPAPANMACWTGVGTFRGKEVAFRVEVEDRGEPAVGNNADATEDVYRLYIWTPHGQETAQELSQAACCLGPVPGGYDLFDGGNLIHGNIQIHPVLPNTENGTCPVPDGSCPGS